MENAAYHINVLARSQSRIRNPGEENTKVNRQLG